MYMLGLTLTNTVGPRFEDSQRGTTIKSAPEATLFLGGQAFIQVVLLVLLHHEGGNSSPT